MQTKVQAEEAPRDIPLVSDQVFMALIGRRSSSKKVSLISAIMPSRIIILNPRTSRIDTNENTKEDQKLQKKAPKDVLVQKRQIRLHG